MVTEADTVVPLSPIASKGSVMVLGWEPVEAGVKVMVAVAVLVESAMFAALIVTVSELAMVAGAV